MQGKMTDENISQSFNVEPHNEYQGFLIGFKDDLGLLKHIISDFPKLHKSFCDEYDEKLTKELSNLSKDDKKQYDEFREYISKLAASHQGLSAEITMRKNVGKYLEKSFFPVKILDKTIPFLMEMCLVYLITTFEELLKNQFKEAAKNNIDILKSGKMLSHEEIIECKNLEEVYSKIMNKVFKEMIDSDIESLSKQIKELLTIDISREPKWFDLTERFYRRHIIIHNNSVPDEKYREKTRTGVTERLVTDEKYLQDSLELFEQFAQIITNFLEEKFPLPK